MGNIMLVSTSKDGKNVFIAGNKEGLQNLKAMIEKKLLLNENSKGALLAEDVLQLNEIKFHIKLIGS